MKTAKEVKEVALNSDLHGQRNAILRNFNFHKVHCYMIEVNWKWADSSGGTVPSIETLKAKASGLLRDVINSEKDFASAGTGGFEARKDKFNEQHVLRLYFVIESWRG